MMRAMGRAAWLSTGLIAVSGCATAPPPRAVLTDPPQTTSAVQSVCPLEHQPFPADDHRPSVDRAPEPVRMVPPEYPATTGKDIVDGTVLVHALICEHGHVVRAVVVKSEAPILNETSVTAMLKCAYRPAERAERPVATWIDVPFRFTLR